MKLKHDLICRFSHVNNGAIHQKLKKNQDPNDILEAKKMKILSVFPEIFDLDIFILIFCCHFYYYSTQSFW